MPDRKPKREQTTGHEPKLCVACGRAMEWRKSWAKNWDAVKYCSDRCRGAKLGTQDRLYEETILRLLEARGVDKSICPSEAARSLAGEDRGAWEPLMEPVRSAARRLAAAGKLWFTQKGQIVDPSTARGAVRLRVR